MLFTSGASRPVDVRPDLRKVKTLVLSDTSVGDRGAASIAKALVNAPDMMHLNLSGCAITDTGAQALGHKLVEIGSLVTLHLARNQVTRNSDPG